MMQEYITYFTD